MSLLKSARISFIWDFFFYTPKMKNSKWSKMLPKESILKVLENKDVKLSTTELSTYFNIPTRRMGELLKFYDITVEKITQTVKLTTDEWITQCKEVHGDVYDYSKSTYVNSHTNVTIICPVHGEIEVSPSRHKLGSGCRRCSAKIKSVFKPLSKEKYIEDASILHNYKYDYSLVDYTTVHDKIIIICPVHGKFYQTAYGHRAGSGCEKCSYMDRGIDIRVPFKEFIERAHAKHGTKYRYLENTYSSINKSVTYICDIHGEIEQCAKTHLLSKGCTKCFSWVQHTTDSFIAKAREVHGDNYVYDKSIYKGRNNINVTITCKYHGDFEQSPMSHMSGSDCPVCAIIFSNSREVENIEDSKKLKSHLYLYKFFDEKEIFYKIGIAKNTHKREYRYDIQTSYKRDKIFAIKMSLYDAASIEQDIIKKYKKYQYYPKIKFDGYTECFNTDLPVVEIISALNQK